MRVTVVHAAPGVEAIVALDLPAGSTVGDAVRRSGLLARHAVEAALSIAIHGQRADAATPLAEGDRVELLRPLTADPTAARRRRAQENPLPRPRLRAKRGKTARPGSKI
jgi:putative ubiquitin-RnfH superfamily antitoxin RatB of RatAB toxin-antitoxin module